MQLAAELGTAESILRPKGGAGRFAGMAVDVSLMRVSAVVRSGDEFDRAHRYFVHSQVLAIGSRL